ncbi:MAG: hypothetical protein SVX43_08400 [Cyanobacteriota bacterium]|nr:hypothetical protein [Cyanobacteriota bacterium]
MKVARSDRRAAATLSQPRARDKVTTGLNSRDDSGEGSAETVVYGRTQSKQSVSS